MTIVSSIRQMVETPIYAINEGSSPIISYNYGAKRPGRVRKAGLTMGALILGYTAVMWSIILLAPHMLINIFSSDTSLMENAVSAFEDYIFAAFIFMDLQYIGTRSNFQIPLIRKNRYILLFIKKSIYCNTSYIYYALRS